MHDPKAVGSVTRDQAVGRQQRQILDGGLRNHCAIEGILMN
jgi:hypothetical protein